MRLKRFRTVGLSPRVTNNDFTQVRRQVRANDEGLAHLRHRPLQLSLLYCIPDENITWRRKQELLTYDEIVLICEIAVGLGVERVRLTAEHAPALHSAESDLHDHARRGHDPSLMSSHEFSLFDCAYDRC